MGATVWHDGELMELFASDRGLAEALDEEAARLEASSEADLAARARVRNGMKLLTHDMRRLDRTMVATIHAYGPVGEKIVKGHGIRFID